MREGRGGEEEYLQNASALLKYIEKVETTTFFEKKKNFLEN